MREGKLRTKGGSKKQIQTMNGIHSGYKYINDLYYPINILEFANCKNKKENLHPTQKPVALLEYLIKTYTNENEVVLDNCFGSNSTGVACVNTNRNYIGIEKDEKYFQIGVDRVQKVIKANNIDCELIIDK